VPAKRWTSSAAACGVQFLLDLTPEATVLEAAYAGICGTDAVTVTASVPQMRLPGGWTDLRFQETWKKSVHGHPDSGPSSV